MTTTAAKTENKTFAEPDETRTFERGQVDLVDIAGTQIGRLTLQPGWRWSEHVKPIAGTDLCVAPHFQYQVQGTLRIRMGDGTEFEATPGTSPRSPRATTPGSSATSRSCSSTGGAPRTTPRADVPPPRAPRSRPGRARGGAGRHDDAVADRLGVRLLGEFRLDGVELDALRSRQARTLLKRLALERGGTVAADSLVEAVWPGAVRPAQPDRDLHVLVSRARSVVGRRPGRTPGRGLRAGRGLVGLDELAALAREAVRRADAGDAVGARTAAEAALALVRGPLLADEPDAEWAADARSAADAPWRRYAGWRPPRRSPPGRWATRRRTRPRRCGRPVRRGRAAHPDARARGRRATGVGAGRVRPDA